MEVSQLKLPLQYDQFRLLLLQLPSHPDHFVYLLVYLFQCVNINILSFGLSYNLLVDLSLLLDLLSQVTILQLKLLWRLFYQMDNLTCTIPCCFTHHQPLFICVDLLSQLGLLFLRFRIHQGCYDFNQMIIYFRNGSLISRKALLVRCYQSSNTPLHFSIHSIEQSLAILLRSHLQLLLLLHNPVNLLHFFCLHLFQMLIQFLQKLLILQREGLVSLSQQFVLIAKMLDCYLLVMGGPV